MRALLLATMALVCSLTSGCASDSSRARTAAQTFLSAMDRGSVPEAQAVATRAARPHITVLLKDNQPGSAGFTLGEPAIAGDTAEVPLTLTQREPATGKVLLRREEKEWRVWALRLQAENGPELMLDFEHPERMVGELLGTAVGELSKSLENLGKNTEKAGRQLGEALGGFMKGLSEGLEKTAPKSPSP